MSFNDSMKTNWGRGTAADGNLFRDEFQRLYDNFNEFINPAGDELEINTLKSTALEVSGNIQCDGTVDGVDLSDLKADYDTRIEYSQQGLFDNAIINGDMRIAQRGTSFASAPGRTFPVDRIKYSKSGGGICTVSQDSDVPDSTPFQYSVKVDVTTTETVAAGEWHILSHDIEGCNAYPLSRYDYMTLSFWSKSSKIGTFCVAIRNSGFDMTYVIEETIDSVDIWKEHIIVIPTNWSGGTWNWTNGTGFAISFALVCGSTFHTTITESWHSGNHFGTSNQTNFFDSTDNNFWITGVKLNKGNIAIPYNPRFIQDELALCQRYYECSHKYEWEGYAVAGADYRAFVAWRVLKRTNTYDITFGAVGGNGFSSSNPVIGTKNSMGVFLHKTCTATGNSKNFVGYAYADDEI